jgi:hypothetical protein
MKGRVTSFFLETSLNLLELGYQKLIKGSTASRMT